MPVYAYRCKSGHETEVQRPVEQANSPARCVECGAPATRLHKLGGISFRGPGFYNTDNPDPTRRRLRG